MNIWRGQDTNISYSVQHSQTQPHACVISLRASSPSMGSVWHAKQRVKSQARIRSSDRRKPTTSMVRALGCVRYDGSSGLFVGPDELCFELMVSMLERAS